MDPRGTARRDAAAGAVAKPNEQTLTAMLTYEITATVRPDLCDAYERYMQDRHIPDLMRTGAFVAASFTRSAAGRYRISYETRSRGELDTYLAEHAPGLRRHFTATFPEGVELSREEWTVLEKWPLV